MAAVDSKRTAGSRPWPNRAVAANEFAANAGVEVGGIRTARQGGFNIRDVGETYSDTKKIEKDVRVVTTITFYLTD